MATREDWLIGSSWFLIAPLILNLILILVVVQTNHSALNARLGKYYLTLVIVHSAELFTSRDIELTRTLTGPLEWARIIFTEEQQERLENNPTMTRSKVENKYFYFPSPEGLKLKLKRFVHLKIE